MQTGLGTKCFLKNDFKYSPSLSPRHEPPGRILAAQRAGPPLRMQNRYLLPPHDGHTGRGAYSY